MGMRWAASMLWIGLLSLCIAPSAWAADEPTAEVPGSAEAPDSTEMSTDYLREQIASEEDPALRAVMEEQFALLESGQLDLQTMQREMTTGATSGSPSGPAEGGTERLANTAPVGFVGPPVEMGAGSGSQSGNSMPPEARAELENIFSQGTGDPSKDGHLREQAEQVMEKYGIERPTFGEGGTFREGGSFGEGGTFEREGGLEQRGEGFERAMTEHMSPEAREQMERFMSERDAETHGFDREREGAGQGGMEREMMEREFGGSSSERSYEAPTHEYEAPTHEFEAPTHEYEAPAREYEAPTHEYEAPTREYEAPEAPTREFEAPEREYEAPTHEYEAPEAPTHEYEAPETPTREYEAMGPGDGSKMGPH